MKKTDAPKLTPRDRRASVAVDLGAESCRVSMLRWLEGGPVVSLVHRFSNGPVIRAGRLHWPLGEIISGVEDGLRRCAELAPEGIASLGVDGWAVDYVRLNSRGAALEDPFCYRDVRTVDAEQQLLQNISAERLWLLTGVQQQRLNTLCQFYADRLEGVERGDSWLNLPEYLLSRWGGAPVAEYTNATHTQMVDRSTGDWSREIFEAAGLPRTYAPKIVPAGTLLGRVKGELSRLPAFAETQLIAPACHDTASAIAGVPDAGSNWAYISSGTWSLVGTLTGRPVLGHRGSAGGFTNLGAVGGANCLHQNLNGMWLLTRCLSHWAAGGASWSLTEVLEAASIQAVPKVLLDLDDPNLLLVDDMPGRIKEQLVGRGCTLVDVTAANAGAVTALILHSLAARYAQALDALQTLAEKRIERIYIVGGGSRNALLNRLTQEATGIDVVAGSSESSTVGNLAVQLAALEDTSGPAGPRFAANVSRWAAALQ